MRAHDGFVPSADGTRIHFQVIGSGRPLLCCNGLACPTTFWRHLVTQFASDYQIVCWDYRGHGKSAPAADPRRTTFADLIADGRAIIEHLQLEGAIGIGHSAGFQILLELYAQSPRRFAALASFLGTPGRALQTLFDTPQSRVWFDLFYLGTVFYPRELRWLFDRISQTDLPAAICRLLGITAEASADFQAYVRHFRQLGPQYYATLQQAAQAHSARHLLPRVRVPTVVIAAAHDVFVPAHVTTQMCRRLPHAELHWIPQGNHGALFECPELFNQRLGQFLWKYRLTPQTSGCWPQPRRARSGRAGSRRRVT